MPATRQLKSFTVKTKNGDTITIQRRCAGDGKLAQAQLANMIYDEATKKFSAPKREKVKPAPGQGADTATLKNAPTGF